MEKKRGQRFSIHIDNELREVFLGHHTLFSVMSFTVGGILIGETIKEYLHSYIGLNWTLLARLILVLLGGVVLHKFSDSKIEQKYNDRLE